MRLYYHREREGQESCIDFTDKVHQDVASKNVSFATFSTLENHAETPSAQGVPATRDDVGLVKCEHTPPSPTPPPLIPPAYLPLVAERLARTPKPRGRHARKRKPVTKAWSRLSPAEKLETTFDRAFQREAIAFSLNFSGKKIAKLETSADPARDLSCAINRVAKTVLGFPLPIAFSFEFTEDDRLHCHGVVILPDWEAETVKRFRQVLKRAGGMMHGVGSGRQIDVKVLTDWKGWNGYRMKDRDRTVTRLGTSKIDYTSNALKQVAREDHDAELEKRKVRRTTRSKPASVKKPSASLTHAPATETRQRASLSQCGYLALVNQCLLTKYLFLFINFKFLYLHLIAITDT